MARRKSIPGEGQMGFDGSEFHTQAVTIEAPAQQLRFNPNQRRAFGSVPRLLDLPVNDSLKPTANDEQSAEPATMQSTLYGNRGGKSVDGLLLNPAEYGAIILNVPTFLERVSAPSEQKHQLSNPFRLQESKLRARMHALDRAQGKHVGVVAGLRSELQTLDELLRLQASPGYAITDEATMRTVATAVWTGSFTNLLRVVSMQSRWDDVKQSAVEEVMLRNVQTGPQKDRIRYWGEYGRIAQVYAQRRAALFMQRTHVIESAQTENNKQLQEFYDKTGFSPV